MTRVLQAIDGTRSGATKTKDSVSSVCSINCIIYCVSDIMTSLPKAYEEFIKSDVGKKSQEVGETVNRITSFVFAIHSVLYEGIQISSRGCQENIRKGQSDW